MWKRPQLMVRLLGFLSIACVGAAALIGEHHPIPGGALMALALVAALAAVVVDRVRAGRLRTQRRGTRVA